MKNVGLITPQIFSEISRLLSALEKDNDVRIVFACESGSRAWGFPSPDSDYDVRFIYVHKRDFYLSIRETRDVIDKTTGDLDVGGWDFRKMLRLMAKSNPVPWEWLQSPVAYVDRDGFKESLLEVS